jgi:hypothetical protein
MSQSSEAIAGRFTATFARSEDAQAFYERLTGTDDFWVKNVRRNRANGKIVTFEATEKAFQHSEGILGYWQDMAETVGYYGSTFGEPPYGSGKRTAYLNGMPGPATM